MEESCSRSRSACMWHLQLEVFSLVASYINWVSEVNLSLTRTDLRCGSTQLPLKATKQGRRSEKLRNSILNKDNTDLKWQLTDVVSLGIRVDSGEYTVFANAPISKGTILGKYLGELTLESKMSRPKKLGYRLQLRDSAVNLNSEDAVCVDASKYGGMMRFLNHSCAPVARFFEVRNGWKHTVVAATYTSVEAGEEITVDYGQQLWFLCKCGERLCLHKGLQ